MVGMWAARLLVSNLISVCGPEYLSKIFRKGCVGSGKTKRTTNCR
jgi:hypothetical protein